jgi:hypothetical protein
MNRRNASTCTMQSAIGTPRSRNRRTFLIAAAVLAAVGPAIAQAGAGAGGEVQQKLAAVKQSAAENQQKLRQYQWTETTQLTLKGEEKPPTQSMCRYGPDGKVQKTPMGPPPQPPSGGRMKQRIIEKKKGEMKDYMGQVKSLLTMYVPPDPQRMQQAFQSGKVSLNATAGADVAQLVFKDYAQPGDRMTLSFGTTAKKISSVKVNTYMDDPKDTVTLAVQMDSLPDGTNYVQQTVLDATAKKLQVTTTNSDYRPIGAP